MYTPRFGTECFNKWTFPEEFWQKLSLKLVFRLHDSHWYHILVALDFLGLFCTGVSSCFATALLCLFLLTGTLSSWDDCSHFRMLSLEEHHLGSLECRFPGLYWFLSIHTTRQSQSQIQISLLADIVVRQCPFILFNSLPAKNNLCCMVCEVALLIKYHVLNFMNKLVWI